jgi:hypothetical protein
MIIGLQIVAILFSFFMIYLAILNFKRHEIGRVEIFSWLIIWLFTILAVVFPELLRTFATHFAVSRLFDLMVVSGFILVITMVTISYLRVKRVSRKLEDLIRREALRNIKKTK